MMMMGDRKRDTLFWHERWLSPQPPRRSCLDSKKSEALLMLRLVSSAFPAATSPFIPRTCSTPPMVHAYDHKITSHNFNFTYIVYLCINHEPNGSCIDPMKWAAFAMHAPISSFWWPVYFLVNDFRPLIAANVHSTYLHLINN